MTDFKKGQIVYQELSPARMLPLLELAKLSVEIAEKAVEAKDLEIRDFYFKKSKEILSCAKQVIRPL